MNNYPENNGTQQPMQEQQVMQAPLTMKWYKFLVCFGLWAGALVSISSGGNTLSGNIYAMQGSEPEYIYSLYAGLRGFDTFRGLMFIACAILAVVTAVSLLKYKSLGPKLLLVLYGANAVANLISYIGEYVIVNAVTPIGFNFVGIAPSIIIGIVMICLNKVYFGKRAHLFNR